MANGKFVKYLVVEICVKYLYELRYIGIIITGGLDV
jgi:hypothetical protein